MTKLTTAARQRTLDKIQQAQALLYEAAQASCDLQGWCKEWEAIGDLADATNALWHRCNNAPHPTGHDAEPAPVPALGLRYTR